MSRKKVYVLVALLVLAIAALATVPATAQGLVTYAHVTCSEAWAADWSCPGTITVSPSLPDGAAIVEGCQASVIDPTNGGELLICHYQHEGDLVQNWLAVTGSNVPVPLMPFLGALQTLTQANADLNDGQAQSLVVKLEQTKALVVARHYLPSSHTLDAVAFEVEGLSHVKGDRNPDWLPVGLMREVAAVLEKAGAITPSD